MYETWHDAHRLAMASRDRSAERIIIATAFFCRLNCAFVVLAIVPLTPRALSCYGIPNALNEMHANDKISVGTAFTFQTWMYSTDTIRRINFSTFLNNQTRLFSSPVRSEG